MKTWVVGKIADRIDRDFIDIQTAYRESGVFYTKDMFEYEMVEAISMTDFILVSMICWYEVHVIFEVELIIRRVMSK